MRISVSLLSRSFQILLLTIVFVETAHVGFAQGTRPGANSEGQPVTTGSAALSEAQIDNIVRSFTAKETQFRRALNEYAFKRDALIQEIGMGGQVVGEYQAVTQPPELPRT